MTVLLYTLTAIAATALVATAVDVIVGGIKAFTTADYRPTPQQVEDRGLGGSITATVR